MRVSLDKVIPLIVIAVMSVAAALPAGVHLKLCVGQDGHQDISAGYCAPSHAPVCDGHGLYIGQDADAHHHGDCEDGYIGCGEDDAFISSRINDPRSLPVCCPALYAVSKAYSHAGSYRLGLSQPFNEHQPISTTIVRSVVLLT